MVEQVCLGVESLKQRWWSPLGPPVQETLCHGDAGVRLMHDKQTLRQTFLHKRQTLDETDIKTFSKLIFQHLVRLSVFNDAMHIAAYLPYKAEVATQPMIEHALTHKKKIYLPVVGHPSTLMSFYPYNQNTSLTLNRFGILEPTTTLSPINPIELDVVLVPLVAFDHRGTRLGSGFGYYDKAFAFLKNEKTQKQTPVLVGLAYSLQESSELIAEPWDIPLDYVLTEKRIIDCKTNQ